MGLLQDWREYAYGIDINSKAGKAIWDKYFKEEKAVYEQLLADPSDIVSGTVGGLPAWNTLLSEERRKELYLKQKKSGTIVKEKKIGRNDPCPCGSGKKYKKCCGANI